MIISFKNNALRLIASKKLEWALLITSLLPFFLVSIFNQPTDDDFHNASKGLTESFFSFQEVLYSQWTGRYTSNFLYALGYRMTDLQSWLLVIKIAPVLWILLLIGSAYFALQSILPFLRGTLIIRLSLWGILLLLYGMPLLASAIYWYCGAAVYTIGSILTLLLVGMTARALWAVTTPARLIWSLLAAVAIIALLGCNEVYIGGVACGICLILLLGQRRTHIMTFFWILALTVGGGITILAPGNFRRAALEVPGGIEFSVSRVITVVLKDLYITQAHWANWSNNALLWLATILVLPTALRIHTNYSAAARSKNWLVYPNSLLLIIIALCGFMLLVGLPTLWFSNDIPQRIWNYTYFLFLPTWFLLIQYLISINSSWHRWLETMPHPLINSMRLLFFILILASNESAVNRAYIDLAFRAKQYNQAYQERYMIVQKASQEGKKAVLLPPLAKHEYQYPLTIFIHDLSPHAKDISNTGLASYFRLDSVYLTNSAIPIVRHLQDR